eukprot:TRINITY_DN25220_c0_g2_i1.p1 TRINITY_DN25220_c0_g2~~TRINITY_DN25220_c0_g2_i1.p1  ORF type:complete len:380 (+),score=68.35 TRINITY_DN25220_c0_g2_i1:84-1223(+)
MGLYLSTPVVHKELDDDVGPENLRLACGSMQGWRVSQEDAHLALPRFDEERGLGLFGVFDGHCGGTVSGLAAKHLPDMIRKSPSFKNADYGAALSEAFLTFDKYIDSKKGREAVKEEAVSIQRDLLKGVDEESVANHGLNVKQLLEELCADNPDNMGCTAIVVILEHENTTTGKPACVHVANCGDSRAVLWDAQGRAHALSRDHKPRSAEERARVEAAGGYVTKEGRIEGNLNLSRALGDFEYKRTRRRGGRPEDQMITGVPEVRRRVLQRTDRFLLLGCDGIWETSRGSQAVVDIVRQAIPPGRRARLSVALRHFLEGNIAKDGNKGLGMDNMTMVLVELPVVTKAPMVMNSKPKLQKSARKGVKKAATKKRTGAKKS